MYAVFCTWTKAYGVSSRAAPWQQSPLSGFGLPCRSNHHEQTWEPAYQWGDQPECLPIHHRPWEKICKTHESLLETRQQWSTTKEVNHENHKDVNILCAERRELEYQASSKTILRNKMSSQYNSYHTTPRGNKTLQLEYEYYLLDCDWNSESLAHNRTDECRVSEACDCITWGQKKRNLGMDEWILSDR